MNPNARPKVAYELVAREILDNSHTVELENTNDGKSCQPQKKQSLPLLKNKTLHLLKTIPKHKRFCVVQIS